MKIKLSVKYLFIYCNIHINSFKNLHYNITDNILIAKEDVDLRKKFFIECNIFLREFNQVDKYFFY